MFDIGIGEIIILGVVGLLVFGPERLPRAYSIASHDHADYVDLCIREVAYSLEGRDRTTFGRWP